MFDESIMLELELIFQEKTYDCKASDEVEKESR